MLVNEHGQIILFGTQEQLDSYDDADLATVEKEGEQITGVENLTESHLYGTEAWSSWGHERVLGVYMNGASVELTLPALDGAAAITYSMDYWADPIIAFNPVADNFNE